MRRQNHVQLVYQDSIPILEAIEQGPWWIWYQSVEEPRIKIEDDRLFTVARDPSSIFAKAPEEFQRYLVFEEASLLHRPYLAKPIKEQPEMDVLAAGFRLAECTTPEAFASFAGQYGPLGVPTQLPSIHGRVYAELLDTYWFQTMTLKESLKNWERLSRLDYDPDPNDPQVQALKEQILYFLKFEIGSRGVGSVSLDLRGKPMVVAKNLRDAIWLQLAQDLSSGTLVRRCEQCDKWFSVRGRQRSGGRERIKVNCSDRCRKNKSGQKRREARNHHARDAYHRSLCKNT